MSLWCSGTCAPCKVDTSDKHYELSPSRCRPKPRHTPQHSPLIQSSTSQDTGEPDKIQSELVPIQSKPDKNQSKLAQNRLELAEDVGDEVKVKTDLCGGANRSMNSPSVMEDYLPDLDCYDLLTSIGTCCEDGGVIYLARYKPSSTLVAFKQLQLDTCSLDLNQIKDEVLIQRGLHHDHLLSCLASFVSHNHLCIVLPLMAFGSCKDLLHAHFTEGLPELCIAYILRDVLQALDYLHSKGIIHRSVRSSHFLVSDDGRVCLTGFRHSYNMLERGQRARTVHDFPDNYVRCLPWASPELLKQNIAGYDTKSDIYSLGIAACELANGVVPFSDMPVTQMLLEKIDGTTPQLLDSVTIPELQTEDPTSGEASDLPYQRTFSQNFRNFVELCLSQEPSNRPSASVLLQHAFFKQLRRKGTPLPPALLYPVTPITEQLSSLTPGGSTEVLSLSQQLEAVAMETDSWDFD